MMSAAKEDSRPKPERHASWAARRLWLRERAYEFGLYDSGLAQSLYASLAGARSRLALMRGRPYEAAGHILKVWRRVGARRVGARRVERFWRIVRESCQRGGELLPAAENRLRLDFVRSEEAKRLRRLYGSFPAEHRVRLRLPRPDPDPERQGDLIILKPYDPTTGERGVIMLMYNEGILAASAVFDLGRLASRYMFVLEPSWWGYQEARFFNYLGSDMHVLIQAQRRPDFEFVESAGTNLAAVRVGAGEWVDPATFRPRPPGEEPSYDAVMVAAWDYYKRHELFFRAAARFKRERGRALRIALVGYPIGWTRETIEGLLRRYGLADDCRIYEAIPHAEVARVIAASSVSLLLSRREGANRGIYESMFCGTPVIVYRHQCGVNLDHVNARTGLLAEDDELADAIAYVLEHPEEFDPRGWATENVGYANATRTVNAALRDMARRRGLPWTRDIAAKKSAPNLRYAEPGLYREFEGEYEALKEYLLPLD